MDVARHVANYHLERAFVQPEWCSTGTSLSRIRELYSLTPGVHGAGGSRGPGVTQPGAGAVIVILDGYSAQCLPMGAGGSHPTL